ncbi:hypothetical protein BSSX_2891 [Bacillus subtilis]|nr:hypothetical protein BSSX_2891 [Bacillus subtilis]
MVGVRFLFERRDDLKQEKKKPNKNVQERSERNDGARQANTQKRQRRRL